MQGYFAACAKGYVDPEGNLRAFLAYSDALLQQLHDPSYGPIGQEFLSAFDRAGCLEICALGTPDFLAHYVPFQGPGTPSFVNSIFYHTYSSHRGVHTKRAYESLCVTRFHEGAHGCAIDSAPILHASPFNGASAFIVSPRDWVLMMERSEQDAFAKQAWLSSLSARIAPDFYTLTQFDPVSAERFEVLRTESNSLKEALARAAKESMTKGWGYESNLPDMQHMPTDSGDYLDFRAYYQRKSLMDYELMIDILKKRGVSVEVVRAAPADIKEIGKSFGPNIFEDGDQDFVSHLPMTADSEARIARLNAKLGIMDEGKLPYFADALARAEMTPRSFMAMSKLSGQKPVVEAPSYSHIPVLQVA